MMQKALVGKVALVTGASRGIGRGIALALASAGAKVYVTGRKSGHSLSNNDNNLPTLEQTVQEISQRSGINVPPLYCDGDSNAGAKVVETIAKTDGRLDILVNNAFAGISAIQRASGKKFFECGEWLWDEIIDVNLRGAYVHSQQAAKLMHQRRSGLIVNISSAGSLQYFFNIPYGVGTTAKDRLTADMAHELRHSNVACVTLWPNTTRTELNLRMIQDDSKREDVEKLTGMKFDTFKRLVENGESPEYVGRAVVALASDPKIMKKTGKIVMTADLGDEYGFTDLNGQKARNMRSVRSTLEFFGWPNMAKLFPSWLRIPCTLMHMSTNKFYKL